MQLHIVQNNKALRIKPTEVVLCSWHGLSPIAARQPLMFDSAFKDQSPYLKSKLGNTPMNLRCRDSCLRNLKYLRANQRIRPVFKAHTVWHLIVEPKNRDTLNLSLSQCFQCGTPASLVKEGSLHSSPKKDQSTQKGASTTSSYRVTYTVTIPDTKECQWGPSVLHSLLAYDTVSASCRLEGFWQGASLQFSDRLLQYQKGWGRKQESRGSSKVLWTATVAENWENNALWHMYWSDKPLALAMVSFSKNIWFIHCQ